MRRAATPSLEDLKERLSREAHLWLVDARDLRDPALLRSYRGLLSADEEARYQRFRVAQARHEFLVGRALLRTTLSRYLPIEPREWSFRLTDHGRPEIAAPAADSDVRFNLSHSLGLIACLVTLDPYSGVDVEALDPAREPTELAGQVFSAAEEGALSGLRPSQQRHLFYCIWTLKEAYLKARGEGLTLGLKQVSFSLTASGEVRVSLGPGFGDRTADWQFGLYRRGPHYLAVALKREALPDSGLISRVTVPLTDRTAPAKLTEIATSPPTRSRF